MPRAVSPPSAERPYRNARLIGHDAGKVTALPGFQRSFHRVPDARTGDAVTLIRKLGAGAVTGRAEGVYGRLRSQLGYKRKDLSYAHDAGAASIQTPDFAVHFTLEQDPAAVDRYRLTTEVSSFQRPEIMADAAFADIFGSLCDQITVDFVPELDVEQAVFALEDWDGLDGSLEDDAGGTTISLTLNQPPVIVGLDRRSMTVRLARGQNLEQLVQFARLTLNELLPVLGRAALS